MCKSHKVNPVKVAIEGLRRAGGRGGEGRII
jgi:hypothetical protein